MSNTAPAEQLGPVELIALAFRKPSFHGSVLRELVSLVERDVIRVLALGGRLVAQVRELQVREREGLSIALDVSDVVPDAVRPTFRSLTGSATLVGRLEAGFKPLAATSPLGELLVRPAEASLGARRRPHAGAARRRRGAQRSFPQRPTTRSWRRRPTSAHSSPEKAASSVCICSSPRNVLARCIPSLSLNA